MNPETANALTTCGRCGLSGNWWHASWSDCISALQSRMHSQEQELADFRQRVAVMPAMQERIRLLESALSAIRHAVEIR